MALSLTNKRARYVDIRLAFIHSPLRRSYYITEALENAIDEFEHEAELIKMVEDYQAGRLETITLDELKENLGLTD